MVSLIIILATAFIYPGIILRTKSIASGRKGPGILQPVKDIAVLLGKGSVFSNTTGIIFRIAPALYLSTILCASLLLPLADNKALVSFEGDFIFFSYLLALGKFLLIAGALDTGSSFEGMGANREAFFSILIEPAFFILMASFAMFTGYTSFSGIFSHLSISGNDFALIFGIICCYLFIQISMIENSRVPVDDPKTHLELTMIHEVMILDYSGFDRALILTGSYLKFAVFGSLAANAVLPAGLNIFYSTGLFFLVQILSAVIIGLLESFRARNKMNRNPKFILTISAISLIAFMVILIMTNKLT